MHMPPVVHSLQSEQIMAPLVIAGFEGKFGDGADQRLQSCGRQLS